jgi:hypothetical protein
VILNGYQLSKELVQQIQIFLAHGVHGNPHQLNGRIRKSMKSENDGRDHQIAKELCKEKTAEKKKFI